MENEVTRRPRNGLTVDGNRALAFIERRGGSVTSRDLLTGCRHIETADQADMFLTALEAMGFGSLELKHAGQNGGRPYEVFTLSAGAPKSVYIKKTKPKRKALSKRIRFEVFIRDGWACQYCGAKSPAVELHVDHITPVSSGGTNELENLITACASCNLGKGARELDGELSVCRRSPNGHAVRRSKKLLRLIGSLAESQRMLVAECCELEHEYGR